MKVFLTGHGGHKPDDGFFNMPRATSMLFYTMHAKLMLASDVYKVVEGSFTGEPHQIIGEYKSCPNMTLYKDDDKFLAPTNDALKRNPDKNNCRVLNANILGEPSIKLKDLLSAIPPDIQCEFHWCCCRDLSLKSTARGGHGSLATTSGMNAAQELSGKFRNFDKATWKLL
jgi:hypothetical protein